MALEGGHEILELEPEGELVTRVTRFEESVETIKPARAPQGVQVTILRLHVPPSDKATLPGYWDVTASTLIPQLRAVLPQAIADGRFVKIRKHGVAPRARFTLELLPREFPGPAFIGTRR